MAHPTFIEQVCNSKCVDICIVKAQPVQCEMCALNVFVLIGAIA